MRHKLESVKAQSQVFGIGMIPPPFFVIPIKVGMVQARSCQKLSGVVRLIKGRFGHLAALGPQ